MAILGYNTHGASGASLGVGRMICTKFTLAAPATLNELHGWFNPFGTATNVRVIIYKDVDGLTTPRPNATRVAYTNAVALGTGSTDIHVQQTGFSVALAAGDYWIGCSSDVAGGVVRGDSTGTFNGGDGYADPPPNPFGAAPVSAQSGSSILSCWAVVAAGATTPVADFTGTPTSGTEPLSVAFTDTSTNTPTSWAWTFGDGGTSTIRNPTHSYTAAGIYTVALTATNSGGANTRTRTGYVTVSDQPRPVRVNTSAGWVDIADWSSFGTGTGPPTAAVGATGAIYLDTASGLLYGPKAGGVWPGTPIPGVPGATGPAGPTGATGATGPPGTTADATTTSKGLVQLAGDLAGTAASPQIASGVIVDADVNAAAAIAESKLSLASDAAAGTASRRTLGTGALQAAAGNDSRFLKAAIGYATTLPASPVDGQEAILVDSTTNPSYQWRFRYNAGSTSAYKWEFIGGPARIILVGPSENTASTTLVDLATVGPSFTLPRAGDWRFDYNFNYANGVQSYGIADLVKNGAGQGLIATAAVYAGGYASACLFVALGGLSAGDVMKLQYRVGAGNGGFSSRFLAITPIRVS